MTKRYLIVLSVLLVLIVLSVLSWFFFRRSSANSSNAAVAVSTPTPSVITVSFIIESGQSYFKPGEIKVKQGDRVRITLNNIEGSHNLGIDEFNAKTKTIQTGESDTVEFLADKKGTFEFYCSVANHRQMGMVGNLIVE
jgi:nitrite reductase (NO-forming)